MLFNSVDFLLFFPFVIIVYFIIPARLKNIWLLLSSYYFYMSWNAKYAILILTSTIITYASGLAIEKIKNVNLDDQHKERYKKLAVALSFILNLGILLYFKYSNFVFSILEAILNRLHIYARIPAFDIVLPVGISFYTFQALSYTMDVYRDEVYAEKNFIQYALFVSFFPQLVAGPIERSKNLLKQLAIPHKFSIDDFREGILLMLWGYFLKIIIADRIAVFVDTVYGDIVTYGGYYLIVATVLFAIQIYCDFAGYSVIAMGAAKVLGIEIMDNFNSPYLSLSVADFWKRWHISLTSWFRDYLYIPLGGNRKGAVRKNINRMIVFLASGLWHGASISFVIWGGLNGLYQIFADLLMPIRRRCVHFLKLDNQSLGYRISEILGTFVLIDFSWIFFRANSASKSIEIIKRMFTFQKNMGLLFDGSLYECGLDIKNFRLLFFGIGLLFFADYMKYKGIKIRKMILKQDYPIRWVIYITAVACILLYGKWGPVFDKAAFIYFQF